MSFQSLAFFGFLAAALAVCLTAGRRSPRAGAAMLAAASAVFCLLGPGGWTVVLGGVACLLAGISAAGASIVTINQSTPENGAALVAVTIRTDTMQMTPEELTERLSRQRMVVGVHCGYNL